MSYIKDLLEMNYEQCADSLIKKYGPVSDNYFLNSDCKANNKKIKRGKEGLYIHHIDEDKAIMLSSSPLAVKKPFSYQHANRLVYCNLVEHLVLHIKIVEFSNPNKTPMEEFGSGGIYAFIVPELNDIYSGIIYKQPWKLKVVEVVLPLKDDYFACLKKLVTLNFNRPLLTTLDLNKDIWNIKNNCNLFQEMKKLGVSN